MSSSFESLPDYLKKYCVTQNYAKYTEREHASWRFIMHQNARFFSKHAVPIYLEGLKKTGIPLDRIPQISEMDEALGTFGWGAVAVEGFIPPAVFLEFQARGCLPIATDMRTLEHISYTPAPDIVHEAAGHAPIIADPEFANYLRRYAKVAQMAIISREDIEVYEAIRLLSDVKENPDTKPGEIEKAEKALKDSSDRVSFVSEAARVARMAWWTVEYGLLGSVQNPKIYGAGLLSSVGESQNCLSDKVKKIPLTLECVETSYDITRPQPQLFVAPNIQRLVDVLDEFEKTMAFKIGGQTGLERAIQAESVNTVVLESGVAVSGQIISYEKTPSGDVAFAKWVGPCQLTFEDVELTGQGRDQHPSGFSTPMGRWRAALDRAPGNLTRDDLAHLGARIGERWQLDFASGFRVSGVVNNFVFKKDRLVLITWHDCTVKRGDSIYYQPDWGPFDMPVGEKVVVVRGGPADREKFGHYNVGEAKTRPGRTSPYTATDKKSFERYRGIRELRIDAERRRGSEKELEQKLQSLSADLYSMGEDRWLMELEVLEIAKRSLGLQPGERGWLKDIHSHLLSYTGQKQSYPGDVIEKGLSLLEAP